MALSRVAQGRYTIEFAGKIVRTARDVVQKLPVSEAGISDDGLPFVRLDNDTILYNHPPEKHLRYIYRLLTPPWFKRKVPEEAFGAAWDAWLRYWSKGIIDQQRYYKLKPGDVALEAGAYIGYYVIKMAQTVGPGGRVIAVEADQENVKIVRRNVEANDLQNVSVVPQGVWNSSGKIAFHKSTRQKNSIVPEVLRGRATVPYTIETNTIDGILERFGLARADFVILTVNGAEIEALKGMPNTLKAGCHLAIAAPYMRNGQPSYPVVVGMLKQRGYAIELDHEGFFRNRDPKMQAVVYASPPTLGVREPQ